MSANEPTNHPVAAAPAATTPVVAGETRPDEVKAVKKRFGIKRLIAAIMLICITVLLLMCLVSGRWTKGGNRTVVTGTNVATTGGAVGTATVQTEEVWTEISIWGSCQCFDINKISHCDQRKHKLNTAKAFSVIAAALEFFAVLVLLWFPYGKRGRVIVAILFALVFCSHVIVVALFGNLFNNKICGFSYESQIMHLDWAYGIRVAEVVLALAVAILVAVRPHGPFVLFFAIICLYLTVFTTTSRGWASRKVYVDSTPTNPHGNAETWEYGLWNYCQCVRAGTYPCNGVQHNMRAAEAFEIIATAVAVILTAFVVKAPKVPRVVGAVLAWLLFVFLILPWIFVAAMWNQKYCGTHLKNQDGVGHLSWAFGIQVVISALMIPTAVFITIM